jgi:hypothetical protein
VNQLLQERAVERSDRDEYRRKAGVQQQQHTGGSRRSRDLWTENDEAGSKEKKKKYRTVVYIYSDQPAGHSDTSDQDKISEDRYQARQPMHALVNKGGLPVKSRNQSVLINRTSSDMSGMITSGYRSPSLDSDSKDYESDEGLTNTLQRLVKTVHIATHTITTDHTSLVKTLNRTFPFSAPFWIQID